MRTTSIGTWGAARRIAAATAVAGTLDILAAIGLTLWFGRKMDAMLRFVASGPMPAAKAWGAGGAVLGLLVHYALMAIMAAVYVLGVDRAPRLKARPALGGIAYGVVTYVIMTFVVVPLRFGTSPSVIGMTTQLFCHVVLVGIPIALIARR